MPSRAEIILQRICLRPTLTLRRQLLISFGSSTLFTLGLVVLFTALNAYFAGENVRGTIEGATRAQVLDNLLVASRNQAAQLTKLNQNVDGTIQLMVEYVKDRIVGYPFEDEMAEGEDSDHDSQVPFTNYDTGEHKYPLDAEPLPADWQIHWNVVPENAKEHLQERAKWLVPGLPTSTASASWFIQGVCDPSITDENHWAYYPNCTKANNDLAAGGVVQPTRTARYLHDVSGDLGILLKPLFEAQIESNRLLLMFFNDGAGATLQFPGFTATSSGTYVSEGCDWLLTTFNPYTGKPLGTPEQVARCQPAGEAVSFRNYNPLERAWYETIARAATRDGTSGEQVATHGPFLVLDSSFGAYMFGKAIFDRKTKEFVGIAAALVPQPELSALVQKGKLHPASEHFVVRCENGAVWADTLGAPLRKGETVRIWETGQINRNEWETLREAAGCGRQGLSRQEINYRTERALFSSGGSVKIVYPLRVPPAEYDPQYEPEFVVVQVLPEEAIYSKAYEVSSAIDDDVQKLILTAVGIGALGVCLVLGTIWCVARFLTDSLAWMERVAFEIVNHRRTGDSKYEPANGSKLQTMGYLPRNEITRLVGEFDKMIHGFSGPGASMVAESEPAEVYNGLTWHTDFRKIYTGNSVVDEQGPPSKVEFIARKRISFSERVNSIEDFFPSETIDLPADMCQDSTALTSSARSITPAPSRLNYGKNIHRTPGESTFQEGKIQIWRSTLFWVIFLLLTIPFLVINSVLCGVMMSQTLSSMSEWIVDAEETSIELEKDSLQTLALSKSEFAASSLLEPVRNVHLLTRLAGWLFFDAVSRAGTFTDLVQGTEECKIYPKNRSCPFFDSDRAPCPCSWEDADVEKYCDMDAVEEETDTRYLQRSIFAVQARDADPVTGRRMVANSFPLFDNTANTTLWQDDIDSLPGAENGANASGFATTYDRLRVASAMAVVEFPIYNHIASLHRETFTLGTFLAFEEDGLFVGFPGCDYGQAEYAHFIPNSNNRAAEVAPELCPNGKYGYDPRCRSWYADGVETFRRTREVLHVTPPYEFVSGVLATSAVSPIVNIPTNEFVGNVLYDFLATELLESYADVKENVVTFVVTPRGDVSGHDTVVGPNQAIDPPSSRIEDLLFLPQDSENRLSFQKNVLKQMKEGENGVGSYSSVTASGEEEDFIVAFAPVTVRSLLPLRHDDYSHGVATFRKLVYSGAAAVREQDLRDPFRAIESDLKDEVRTTNVAFLWIISLVSILLAAFTCLVTVNIVWPIVVLLRTLERINVGKANRIPPVNGGSIEVRQVYSSFAKLCWSVRTSNTAFFSGNIEVSSHILDDALKLYRKIGNARAVGVACNNLANTFYATMHNEKVHGIVSDRNKSCCDLISALSHYDEAVDIANADFESEQELTAKACFAEQLADRLFNRGLFFLLAEGEDGCPNDAKERGLNDITRTRQLDYDVRGYWLDQGMVPERSANLFSRMVRRLHGLVTFYDDDDLRSTWDAKELVSDADELLSVCSTDTEATVLRDLTLNGRLQQLEAAVIRLETWLKNYPEAARMGMRMFAEDEFVLETSFQIAAASLLQLHQESAEPLFSPKVVSSIKSDIRQMLQSCKSRPSVSISKCMIVCIELGEQWDMDPLLEELNSCFLRLYDEGCSDDDLMGLVSQSRSDQGDSLTFCLGPKSDNAGLQRSTLDIATNMTARSHAPTLPVALQMIIDSEETAVQDTYVIVVSDGFNWNERDADTLLDRLHRLNAERTTDVHIIGLCLGVRNHFVLDFYKRLGSLTPESNFFSLDSGNVDSVFRDVISIVSNDFHVRGDLQGITMEQF